jgi:hypothetical protein
MKTHIRFYHRLRHSLAIGLGVFLLPFSILADDHGGTAPTATVWNSPDIAGNIESVADVDWFRFTVTVPGRIWIYTTGETDVTGSIRNSAEALIDSSFDDGSAYNIESNFVAGAGTYYVAISAGSSAINLGNYTLHLRAPQNAAAFNGPNLSAALTLPGEIQIYRFPMEFTSPVVLFTTGDMDTKGELYNAAGAFVKSSFDDGAGYNFSMEDVLSAGNSWYLLVRGGTTALNTGSYTLSQRKYSNAFPIGGTSHSGSVQVPGDLDLYRISVAKAGPVWIYTTGDTDTRGVLYNTAGALVNSDFDDGAGYNFLMTSSNLAAGTYYLWVSGGTSAVSIGDYQLEIRQASTAIPITSSGSVGHSIVTPGDIDMFVFNAGGATSFQTLGTTDTYGALLNAGGALVTSDFDDGAGGNFSLASSLTAGVHYLFIRGQDLDTVMGAYTLQSNFTGAIGSVVSLAASTVAADSANSASLSLSGSGAWSVGGLPAWAVVSPAAGSGSANLAFTFQPNTTGAARSATLNIGGSLVTLHQPAAAVHLAGPGLTIADAVLLTLPTTAGVTYTIESSSDLTSWQATALTITGDGSTKSVTVPRIGGRGWFRAVAY